MPKTTLRARSIRLASTLPKGSQERRELLGLLAREPRLGSTTKLRLFHGTVPKHVRSIKSKGLLSKNYDQAEWYVLATDFESALFHATAEEGEDAYVVEFEVEVDREPWFGFPHLWPPYTRGSGSWFALKAPLGPKMIRKVHQVPYAEFRAQKSRGF